MKCCWLLTHPAPILLRTPLMSTWIAITSRKTHAWNYRKRNPTINLKKVTTDCVQILAKKTNSAKTPNTHFYIWFTFDGLILKTHFEWVNERCSLISQMSQHSSSSQKVGNNSMTQCKICTYPWDTKFQRFKRWVAETVSQEATIIFDSEHIIICIAK